MVLAGHRLGVAIVAASPDWLETVDESASTYTVDLGKTALQLPSRVTFAKPGTPAFVRGADVPTRSELVRGTLPSPDRRQPPH